MYMKLVNKKVTSMRKWGEMWFKQGKGSLRSYIKTLQVGGQAGCDGGCLSIRDSASSTCCHTLLFTWLPPQPHTAAPVQPAQPSQTGRRLSVGRRTRSFERHVLEAEPLARPSNQTQPRNHAWLQQRLGKAVFIPGGHGSKKSGLLLPREKA